MKFIGHLDMMRYFQKVMRRADVDIRYSEGFSPHSEKENKYEQRKYQRPHNAHQGYQAPIPFACRAADASCCDDNQRGGHCGGRAKDGWRNQCVRHMHSA